MSVGALTIHVTGDVGGDEVDILPDAVVKIARNAEAYGPVFANSVGDAVFPVTVGGQPWTYIVTNEGYAQFTSTVEFTSDLTEITANAVLALLGIPTASAGTVTGYLTTYDEDGEAEDDIEIQVALDTGPGEAGTSHPRTIRKIISSGGGLVTLPLLESSTYRARRKYTDEATGDSYGDWVTFETGIVSPFALPEVLGKYLTGE